MNITLCRCYGRADMQTVPSCVKECWELLSSEPFFILLSNLTGLGLHFLTLCDDEDDDESEDGKSETENGDGEVKDGTENGDGNTHAGGSSSTTETSSADKKDKGEQLVQFSGKPVYFEKISYYS